MLDDLRNSIDDDFGDDEEEQLDLPINFDEIEAQQARYAPPKRGFLGMTAGERAFLSVMLFVIVLVLGAAVLALTGRIAI